MGRRKKEGLSDLQRAFRDAARESGRDIVTDTEQGKRGKRNYSNLSRTVRSKAKRLKKERLPREKHWGRTSPRHLRNLEMRMQRLRMFLGKCPSCEADGVSTPGCQDCGDGRCPQCGKIQLDPAKWFVPQRFISIADLEVMDRNARRAAKGLPVTKHIPRRRRRQRYRRRNDELTLIRRRNRKRDPERKQKEGEILPKSPVPIWDPSKRPGYKVGPKIQVGVPYCRSCRQREIDRYYGRSVEQPKTRNDFRIAARERKLPPDRICSTCGEGPIFELNRWYAGGEGVVECISCRRRRLNQLKREAEKSDV